jgi:hypothetical protein
MRRLQDICDKYRIFVIIREVFNYPRRVKLGIGVVTPFLKLVFLPALPGRAGKMISVILVMTCCTFR